LCWNQFLDVNCRSCRRLSGLRSSCRYWLVEKITKKLVKREDIVRKIVIKLIGKTVYVRLIWTSLLETSIKKCSSWLNWIDTMLKISVENVLKCSRRKDLPRQMKTRTWPIDKIILILQFRNPHYDYWVQATVTIL